ncbi:hypothetical protein LCGC14_1425390 [marine sediment metagenome]|uniref:Uncharacterized protein n=1 Tax=marine sediment metagenome TaxID=412755 RepID=A0A0F9JQK9_9ZZZZ
MNTILQMINWTYIINAVLALTIFMIIVLAFNLPLIIFVWLKYNKESEEVNIDNGIIESGKGWIKVKEGACFKTYEIYIEEDGTINYWQLNPDSKGD